MLESLTKETINDTLSLDNLQNMLRRNLTGKKYLLVLDDIWNESFEKWAQLRTYLMCGAKGSKVVVTTRSKIVAERMGVSVSYNLNGLTLEKSWSLLKYIITYGDETKGVNQTLETIGKKIAEKCSGVPLAIRTLGGLLQGKTEEREWIDVLQGDFWKLCEDEESIMPVLKLSYQNLSPQLRQCFAYCSLFPKDWKIEKDGLIQLWMAQGYLECSDEKQRMEDIGNQFVTILLMKSFFQDAQIDDGDIRSFKMHDLIHDLAMKVAGNDCCYLDSETKRLVGNPMHIMLKRDAFGFLESLSSSKMRTLILLAGFSEKLNEKELLVISKFKYLRALKLMHCSSSKLCDSIEKLNHLRYLNLRDCRSCSTCISNLVCLQTLLLRRCYVEFSSEDISKLINLRYFDIEDLQPSEQKKRTSRFGKLGVWGQHKSVIISNWSSLSNIVQICLHDCHGLQFLPPMERLPFLKSLSVYYLDELEVIYYEEPLSSESFFPSLKKLMLIECRELTGWRRMRDGVKNDNNSSQLYHLSFPRLSELDITGCDALTHMPTFPKLEELSLEFSKVEALEATLNMVGSKRPIEFPPLSMLKYLHIGGNDLNVKKLPDDWLQNLTSLKHLGFRKVLNKKFQEIGIWFRNDTNCLPFLESITFLDCKDLEVLPDWICNLSSLHRINLLDCECLASLPEGMPGLVKLQTLQIADCPDLIEECETKTSATWPKIAHIPNIILNRY